MTVYETSTPALKWGSQCPHLYREPGRSPAETPRHMTLMEWLSGAPITNEGTSVPDSPHCVSIVLPVSLRSLPQCPDAFRDRFPDDTLGTDWVWKPFRIDLMSDFRFPEIRSVYRRAFLEGLESIGWSAAGQVVRNLVSSPEMWRKSYEDLRIMASWLVDPFLFERNVNFRKAVIRLCRALLDRERRHYLRYCLIECIRMHSVA